ncbi:ANK-REP-REGION domain-containing protein [Mycena indigotica]|uniref:ANK-REP-REGION domain-containing protein n=1 Tax=Mycena indigotica TaxID=2126181 RepID=A0A8H6WGN0_9AGAR|nr:ANK-REP-REGION domain-containing protein [Mycena indigotica]KAF7316036.1 ANK-REP-REGION domain-containing protein [Mycena indigotica]
MGEVDLSVTYGAMFVGVLFATFFQGVLTLQTYLYYANFPKDHIFIKLLVACVWLLDVAHLVLISQSCYHYLVQSWGDGAALLISTQELDLHLVFVGFACFVCQCFFLSRIWNFSQRNWMLTIVLGIPCLVIFILEATISGEISRIPSVSAFDQFTGEVLSVFALAAAVDLAIAIILVWYLRQGKTSFDRSSFVVDRIVQYTVATGLATSVLAVADLIVYLATPNTFIFIAMHFSMGRLYTNALLATLNSRQKLRQALEGGGANSLASRNMAHASTGPSFAFQVNGIQTGTTTTNVHFRKANLGPSDGAYGIDDNSTIARGQGGRGNRGGFLCIDFFGTWAQLS